MSRYIEVYAIVEGRTEQVFVERLLAPYLGQKGIGMRATQVSKPGQKGGDVRFSRVKNDLELHLKQRSDSYVTTFVDYYGLKAWPGLDAVLPQASPEAIAKQLYEATQAEVDGLFAAHGSAMRFVPFIAIHEFEALLFSDAQVLAKELGVKLSEVEKVISAFKSPEAINNRPETAPSKRLETWSSPRAFMKTTVGIGIATDIGIEKMRERCTNFDQWLSRLEAIQRGCR